MEIKSALQISPMPRAKQLAQKTQGSNQGIAFAML
jgi:hypothetical protein